MAAFTTIAAGVGLATTAVGTGMSFTQAAKQNKLQREAESEATKAMAEARKKLDVNFYEQLGIQKEPYELEREAALSSGAQLIEAGRESERGAAATAGRVQMMQNQAQRQIAAAMGQEMLGLEKLTAQEESRLRDMGVNLDLEEAAGASLREREAARLGAAATKQGIQGLQSLGQQAMNLVPLYQKTASSRLASNIDKSALGAGLSQSDLQRSVASLGTVGGVDFSGVSNMKPFEFQDFMQSNSPSVLKEVQTLLPNVYNSQVRPSGFGLQNNYGIGYNQYRIPGIGG
jgi:hypothetical protein